MSQNKNGITLGSDPEFFLYSKEEKIFFPALGVILGNKDIPYDVLEPGFSTQVDNMMCEVNIPASASPEEFSNNLQRIIDWVKEDIPKSLVVKIQPSAEFTEEMLKSDQALVVGCSSDYSAYTGENVSVKDLSKSNWRFAGGHVHVGYPEPSADSNPELVKWMDIYLGLPSVILDNDDRRKAVYGTPGRYRDKDFGVEYRTLSNWWVAKDEYRRWVFEQTKKAYYAFSQKVEIGTEMERNVQDCIENNNSEQATILMGHFGVLDNAYIEILNLKISQNATERASNN